MVQNLYLSNPARSDFITDQRFTIFANRGLNFLSVKFSRILKLTVTTRWADHSTTAVRYRNFSL